MSGHVREGLHRCGGAPFDADPLSKWELSIYTPASRLGGRSFMKGGHPWMHSCIGMRLSS